MSAGLRTAAAGYLALRRSLGYQLVDHEWLINKFLDLLNQRGHTTITVADALDFAQAPAAASRGWHARRLAVIRGLAAHIHTDDPTAAQLIPPGLIPAPAHRPMPYLYSPEQVVALIAQAATLRPSMLAASMATLIGLLAATGIRGGEAFALDVENLAPEQQLLTVTGKYGKQRLLPLHPSTVTALCDYLQVRTRVVATAESGPLLVGQHGRRLNKIFARAVFRRIVDTVGLPARPGTAPPRLHDFRHTFAVDSLIDAHRDGVDIDARVAALCTYLGHSEPAHTYWYLTATPQLMALVAQRVATRWEGTPR